MARVGYLFASVGLLQNLYFHTTYPRPKISTHYSYVGRGLRINPKPAIGVTEMHAGPTSFGILSEKLRLFVQTW